MQESLLEMNTKLMCQGHSEAINEQLSPKIFTIICTKCKTTKQKQKYFMKIDKTSAKPNRTY